MNDAPRGGAAERPELERVLAGMRAELHRYCSRLVGSVIDGEDVLQDVMIKIVGALDGPDRPTNLRGWAFRTAHNLSIDLLRRRKARAAEPLDAAMDAEDPHGADPLDAVLRDEALRLAVARFLELPLPQRGVVILKDVLDEPIAGIADVMGLTTNAVKAHLARGRTRLRAIAERPDPPVPKVTASPEVARYVALFNARQWDALRGLLAQDVRLKQAHRPPLAGAEMVGRSFTFYDRDAPVFLDPGWLEGREVIWVRRHEDARRPDYFMWLEWSGGRITFIHDYRYADYIMDGVWADRPAAPDLPLIP